MPGLFDDLIPQGRGQQAGTNPFADLLPQQQAQANKQEMPGWADTLASLGAGVERGITSMAGLPGTVGQLMRDAAGIEGPRPTGLTPTGDQVLDAYQSVRGELHEPQTTVGEYARTVGEFAPMALFGTGGAAARLAQTTIPAVASETAGQMTSGSAAEPYARAAGALVGSLTPAALARAVTPLPIQPGRQAAANALRAEGITPTAGQLTGNRFLQYAESELGGAAAARALDRQNDEFTRAVLRRVGENAERATPEVVDRAFTRIGGQFDRLAQRNRIDPGTYGKLRQDLAAVQTEYADLVPPASQARIINKTMTDLAGRMSRGQPIPGNVYQAFRSRFDRMARASRNDPQLSEALYGIRNAMDEAMERSINTADAAAWQEARRQYRNMLVVEKAATGAGSDAAMGAISPAKLRQADVAQNKRRFVRGKSDFSELAHSGQALMTPLPQSGTAPRAAAHAIPAALGAALGGGFGGAAEAVMGTMAGIAAPAAAGRVLMSRPVQAYLRNQLVPRGNVRNALARGAVLSGNALITSR